MGKPSEYSGESVYFIGRARTGSVPQVQPMNNIKLLKSFDQPGDTTQVRHNDIWSKKCRGAEVAGVDMSQEVTARIRRFTMMRFYGKQSILFLFLLFLSLVSMFGRGYARTTASLVAGWRSMQPIEAGMLVMIPREFEEFTYIFSHKGGGEMRLPVGDQASDLLEKLLRSAFTSTTFMPVPSEAVAKDMISREDPKLLEYDFVAVPRILNVSSWDRGPEYGFGVDLSLEISSFDTKTVETINGHGESSTPEGAGFTPVERLGTAVSYALDAIKDGIQTRHAAWSR
jgi:hypothetical protein